MHMRDGARRTARRLDLPRPGTDAPHPILALQRSAGNAAVTRWLAREDEPPDVAAREGSGELPPDPGLPFPQSEPVVEVPVDSDASTLAREVDPASASIGAASLAVSLRQADLGALSMQHVQFRMVGATQRATVTEREYAILLVDSTKSLGTAWAWFSLFLRFDGINVLSGYTRLLNSSGYAGGPFGSDAAVTFSAVEASGPVDPLKRVYITCDGTNNPNGPGFQKFFARFTASGDGSLTVDSCQVTVGDGVTRTKPNAYSGWR